MSILQKVDQLVGLYQSRRDDITAVFSTIKGLLLDLENVVSSHHVPPEAPQATPTEEHTPAKKEVPQAPPVSPSENQTARVSEQLQRPKVKRQTVYVRVRKHPNQSDQPTGLFKVHKMEVSRDPRSVDVVIRKNAGWVLNRTDGSVPDFLDFCLVQNGKVKELITFEQAMSIMGIKPYK